MCGSFFLSQAAMITDWSECQKKIQQTAIDWREMKCCKNLIYMKSCQNPTEKN
jgi:hypothetical protein